MSPSQRTVVGVVLILAGSALFALAVGVGATGLPTLALAPATVLLAAGTYLVGTDVGRSPA